MVQFLLLFPTNIEVLQEQFEAGQVIKRDQKKMDEEMEFAVTVVMVIKQVLVNHNHRRHRCHCHSSIVNYYQTILTYAEFASFPYSELF